MRALLQRVTHAAVTVHGRETGRIGPGLLILLGIAATDTATDAQYLVDKTVNLRIFPDEQNRFHHSALDTRAELLIVSQFTLYADTRKGRRPAFTQAAPPEQAQPLYHHAVQLYRNTGLAVATGRFQEQMQITLRNDGPVTLLIDTADRHLPRRP